MSSGERNIVKNSRSNKPWHLRRDKDSHQCSCMSNAISENETTKSQVSREEIIKDKNKGKANGQSPRWPFVKQSLSIAKVRSVTNECL